MAQKRPNLVQNLHFWSFWAKYCHFLHILSNARPKNYMNKVPRWVFRDVGNKTFDFFKKNKEFLPKIGIFVHFGPAHLVPCWWVGWWLWRTGCISQDTYLLYVLFRTFTNPHGSCSFSQTAPFLDRKFLNCESLNHLQRCYYSRL